MLISIVFFLNRQGRNHLSLVNTLGLLKNLQLVQSYHCDGVMWGSSSLYGHTSPWLIAWGARFYEEPASHFPPQSSQRSVMMAPWKAGDHVGFKRGCFLYGKRLYTKEDSLSYFFILFFWGLHSHLLYMTILLCLAISAASWWKEPFIATF